MINGFQTRNSKIHGGPTRCVHAGALERSSGVKSLSRLLMQWLSNDFSTRFWTISANGNTNVVLHGLICRFARLLIPAEWHATSRLSFVKDATLVGKADICHGMFDIIEHCWLLSPFQDQITRLWSSLEQVSNGCDNLGLDIFVYFWPYQTSVLRYLRPLSQNQSWPKRLRSRYWCPENIYLRRIPDIIGLFSSFTLLVPVA